MECMDRQLRSSPPEIPVTRYVPRRTRHGPIPFALRLATCPFPFPFPDHHTTWISYHAFLLLASITWLSSSSPSLSMAFWAAPSIESFDAKKSNHFTTMALFFSHSEQASALALQKGRGRGRGRGGTRFWPFQIGPGSCLANAAFPCSTIPIWSLSSIT